MNALGTILKLKRIEKKIRQEDLCQGICTTSYLSRIENNKTIANEEIYRLLFDRLGLDYDKIFKLSSQLDKRIEKWYEDLLNRKCDTENIDELKELAFTAGGETSIKFEIVYCRYLLMNNQLEEAEKILMNLRKIFRPELSRNFFIYSNVLVYYYILVGGYSQAAEAGLALTRLVGYENLGKDFELGIFNYNLGLSSLKHGYYETALNYAEKALSIFKDGFYIDRAMDCLIILGVCHNNLKNWDKAIYSFELAKRTLQFLPEKVHERYWYMISNNLGNCHEYKGEYDEAVHYYLQALKYLADQNKIIPLINLIRCYYNMGDLKSARFWLESAERTIKLGKVSKKEWIQIDIFSTLLKEPLSLEEINDIQKTSIQYFLSIEDWIHTIRYCGLFAKLYESQNRYKQANELYKIAFQANEKIKSGGDSL
ncbi:MAG: hypothetical protein C6W57_02665 [Caldibacillus debilis]|uniref:helix-turn-helix transcriptional regulator n=1 Tax=Caldibacillus debilis TaxID=301148 RepID=UPI000B56F82A|nr:helix-turn-helix transcriptional regulator [Caldibacillus debilis]MBY6273984.1 hypothetical protein [Bacillaceae bacterium]OUM89004.1 MAG: hypothetical protein BAA03_02595 [Caldibacillus debilis]REJ18772.1 MAG: hypothetical protein C6W57_02665 [Caldibacillus debilis]